MDYLLGLFSSSTIFQVRARWITSKVKLEKAMEIAELGFYKKKNGF
jgi:hypothetical protein